MSTISKWHVGVPYTENTAADGSSGKNSADTAQDALPDRHHTVRVMLLGSGELGKEIAIELMRLGAWVCAADSYAHAPAMHIAHESRVLDMSDPDALQDAVTEIHPDIIVPEVEAIATQVLMRAAGLGIQVTPSAAAVQVCMDREALRTLAHDRLGLPTVPYLFAGSLSELRSKAAIIGFPCVVKPVMSSSGHGQSIVYGQGQLEEAWSEAQSGRRAAHEGEVSRVIIEALAPLDYELTILTVASSSGVAACSPIRHIQENGDYRESWQPAHTTEAVMAEASSIAHRITEGLVAAAQENGELGWGVYGVEIFVLSDGRVLFNEVSPRPHDTGMVTLISQDLSEFALHARAILGIPVPQNSVGLAHPGYISASRAIVIQGEGQASFSNLARALRIPHSDLRIFGKPGIHGRRRMGIALAYASNETKAREAAAQTAQGLTVTVSPIKSA